MQYFHIYFIVFLFLYFSISIILTLLCILALFLYFFCNFINANKQHFPLCGVRDPSAASRPSLGTSHRDEPSGFPGFMSPEDAVGDTVSCHPSLGTSSRLAGHSLEKELFPFPLPSPTGNDWK